MASGNPILAMLFLAWVGLVFGVMFPLVGAFWVRWIGIRTSDASREDSTGVAASPSYGSLAAFVLLKLLPLWITWTSCYQLLRRSHLFGSLGAYDHVACLALSWLIASTLSGLLVGYVFLWVIRSTELNAVAAFGSTPLIEIVFILFAYFGWWALGLAFAGLLRGGL